MQPDFLSQLNDIQTPEQIGWWPIAWGWYAIALISILLIVLTTVLVLRHIKTRRAKKQALAMLNQLNVAESPLIAVRQINDIFKRVVLSYVERSDVAELSGKEWANWLNQHSTSGAKIDVDFVSLAYARTCQVEQANAYLQQTKTWISKNLPLKVKTLPEVADRV